MGFKDPEARRRYHQQYYQANKDKYTEHGSAWKIRAKERFQRTIRGAKDAPCTDCNERYPYYVMQFDHIGEKNFTISTYPYTASIQRLLDEIAKCEIVCANCHAERTHQRREASTRLTVAEIIIDKR